NVGLIPQKPIAGYNIPLPGSLFRTDARNVPTCFVGAQERRRGLFPSDTIQIRRRTYRPNDRSGNADTLPVVEAHFSPCRLLVAPPTSLDLFICAKHLFVEANAPGLRAMLSFEDGGHHAKGKSIRDDH